MRHLYDARKASDLIKNFDYQHKMSNKIASKRYSTALFDSVKNEELDALLKDAQSLSKTMSDNEELSSLLKSPLTKNELK